MVDECPQCGNRGVTSARKHEKERKRNLALMMDGFAEEADNPQNCAHALHTLMTYDMQAWFHDVRKSYGLRFETNMQIQYLIAQGLSRFGSYKEAMIYCRKSIVLGAGKPAEELLAYCEKLIEASKSPSDIEALKVKPESSFRAYIPLITMTMLPAIALIAVGVSSLRNYTAWIVNGSLQTYTFTLDDQTYTLEPGATRQVSLRLGEHELKFNKMPPRRFSYSVPLIKQLMDKNLLVINPDAMALLTLAPQEETTHHADNRYSHTGQIRIFPGIGTPVHGLNRIKADEPRISSISLYRPQSHIAMVNLMNRLGLKDAAVQYAYRALSMNPNSEESAQLLTIATQSSDDLTVRSFLQKGLNTSPALLPWHIHYQNYMHMHHPEHNLVSEYTLRCKTYADDPASFYLLAQVVHDRQTAYRFYEHSDKNGGMNGRGYYAIAKDLYVRGSFKAALPYSRKALQMAPETHAFQALNMNILLALRDYEALLGQNNGKAGSQGPLEASMQRILYLTCAGYHQEADREIFELSTTNSMVLPQLNALRFYAVGNSRDYLECMVDMGHPHAEMELLLHDNAIPKADKLISLKEDHPYWEHLVLYCAAMNQDLPQIAARNFNKAIAEINPDSRSYIRVKRILEGKVEVTEEEIRSLNIDLQEKTILCVALDYRHPDLHAMLSDLARLYNFTPAYPQLLVKHWIRNLEKTKTAASDS